MAFYFPFPVLLTSCYILREGNLFLEPALRLSLFPQGSANYDLRVKSNLLPQKLRMVLASQMWLKKSKEELFHVLWKLYMKFKFQCPWAKIYWDTAALTSLFVVYRCFHANDGRVELLWWRIHTTCKAENTITWKGLSFPALFHTTKRDLINTCIFWN